LLVTRYCYWSRMSGKDWQRRKPRMKPFLNAVELTSRPLSYPQPSDEKVIVLVRESATKIESNIATCRQCWQNRCVISRTSVLYHHTELDISHQTELDRGLQYLHCYA
jgi:hypothetical protein